MPGSHFTPTGPRILPPARREEEKRRRTAADAATPGREEGGRALNVIFVSLILVFRRKTRGSHCDG